MRWSKTLVWHLDPIEASSTFIPAVTLMFMFSRSFSFFPLQSLHGVWKMQLILETVHLYQQRTKRCVCLFVFMHMLLCLCVTCTWATHGHMWIKTNSNKTSCRLFMQNAPPQYSGVVVDYKGVAMVARVSWVNCRASQFSFWSKCDICLLMHALLWCNKADVIGVLPFHNVPGGLKEIPKNKHSVIIYSP